MENALEYIAETFPNRRTQPTPFESYHILKKM